VEAIRTATAMQPIGGFLRIAGCLLLLACLQPVLADEGRLEINQACATGGGCFSGDDPGFPVEIADSGSYVLTGSLDVPADTNGIALLSGNVMIDLDGMVIQGPVSCTGVPVTSCSSQNGEFDGVSGESRNNVRVLNGSVLGFAGHGINLGNQARVRDLSVRENGANGIKVADRSVVRRSDTYRNLGHGVEFGASGLARDLSSSGNGDFGILMADGARVLACDASENAETGIFVNGGSVVRGSAAHGNGHTGITVNNGDNVVTDSSARDNADLGLLCFSFPGEDPESALRNVALSGNNDGGSAQLSSPECVETGNNLCSGDTLCP